MTDYDAIVKKHEMSFLPSAQQIEGGRILIVMAFVDVPNVPEEKKEKLAKKIKDNLKKNESPDNTNK